MKLLIRTTAPRAKEVKRTLGTFVPSLAEFGLAMDREGGDNVLHWNLQRLIRSLGPGGQTRLAQDLSIDPTTVSRWYRGKHRPTPTHLNRLRDRFGLPEGTDLRDEPLFASTDPVGEAEQKAWLHERIGQLDAVALRELFPALRRIMGER